MRNFFQQLRPLEQRLVIATAVILFILANWIWVVPHFSDWKRARTQMEETQKTIVQFQKQIEEGPTWEAQKKKLEGEGSVLPSEEMALKLRVFVDEQAALSGLIEQSVTVGGSSSGRGGAKSTGIFEERTLTMGYISGDAEMVDFLYNLGAGKSTIRVRDLTIKPDTSLGRLQGNMTLVASYQKKAAAPKSSSPAVKSTNAPVAKPAVKTAIAPAAPNGTTNRVPPREFKSKM
jgi:hypothetical protein